MRSRPAARHFSRCLEKDLAQRINGVFVEDTPRAIIAAVFLALEIAKVVLLRFEAKLTRRHEAKTGSRL
jgi:hypothetical protein